MKSFCLVGVKGIGKNTLIDAVIPKCKNVIYYSGSSLLKKLVGNNFEYFDSFSNEQKHFYREAVIKFLIQLQKKEKKNLILDGHTILYNPYNGQIEKVFTELDCTFYTDLILYESSAEEILERRKNDKTKKRLLQLSIIKKEIDAERKEALRICNQYNINFHLLNQERFEDLQNQLLKILSE